jgi:hypothetical protein
MGGKVEGADGRRRGLRFCGTPVSSYLVGSDGSMEVEVVRTFRRMKPDMAEASSPKTQSSGGSALVEPEGET